MNFIPCLTWIQRGVAKSIPDKLKLSPEELKEIMDGTMSNPPYCEIQGDIEKSPEKDSENDEDIEIDDENADLEAKYNLQDYDEDDDNPIFTMRDLTVYADNKDDNYITTQDEEDEDEIGEQEDFKIKETDNILIVGRVHEESSIMEIYVYNKEDEAFYVHHDIVLPAFPLALEWLDFHPSDDTPGNYIAVGDMTSLISIWDLDIVDVLEPEYILGKLRKKKQATANKKTSLKYGHSDAVLSLCWNKQIRNNLVSGSADTTVGIWDLQNQTLLNRLNTHSAKVQSVQWSPLDCNYILSGSADGTVVMNDWKNPDSEHKSWKVDGEIEKLLWNPIDPYSFFCSTDIGFVHKIDIRTSDIVYSFQAHNDAITGLETSSLFPYSLVTAGMDRTLKIWDTSNELTLLKMQKLKVGSIYSAKVAPDLPFTIAVGGNDKSNNLKIIDVLEDPDCCESLHKVEGSQKRIKQENGEIDLKDCKLKSSHNKQMFKIERK